MLTVVCWVFDQNVVHNRWNAPSLDGRSDVRFAQVKATSGTKNFDVSENGTWPGNVQNVVASEYLWVARAFESQATPMAQGRSALSVVKGQTPKAKIGMVVTDTTAHLSVAPLAPLDGSFVPYAVWKETVSLYRELQKQHLAANLLGSWYMICLVSFKWGYQWYHSPPVNPSCLQATFMSVSVQFRLLVQTDRQKSPSSTWMMPSLTLGPSTSRMVRLGDLASMWSSAAMNLILSFTSDPPSALSTPRTVNPTSGANLTTTPGSILISPSGKMRTSFSMT